jgi:hypothetical protein
VERHDVPDPGMRVLCHAVAPQLIR